MIKHPDIRQAELFDRALTLFLQRGYDNVSLNDLIAHADLESAFYHRFPSKDILTAALTGRSDREQLAAVDDALAIDRIPALPDGGVQVLTCAQAQPLIAALPPIF